MKDFKHFIYILILLLAMVAFNGAFAAGPPGPPGGGGGPGCWPPPCVPIDGGISFLLLAGAAYGGKKVFDLSQEKRAD